MILLHMKVAIWDTYVTKKNGNVMHFDIVVPETIQDSIKVIEFGKAYLQKKGQSGQPLTTNECRFCHVETLKPEWEETIREQGYHIYEMEGCEEESSVFDPIQQNSKIESKIVVALERISEAFRVLLWQESKEEALSPIQIQILIFLLYHQKEVCKVGYLAQEFNMTKATISDSVKVLLQKRLVEKEIDSSDTRSFSLSLSSEGEKIARRSATFAGVIEKPLFTFTQNQKEVLLDSLLQLIEKLNKSGIITIPRMCVSCRFYKQSDGGHFCNLLQQPLASNELRVDCPEHEIGV